MSGKNKTFICPKCGSAKILYDATARWNSSTQSFEISTVYTGEGSEDALPICDDCGEEIIPIEKELI